MCLKYCCPQLLDILPVDEKSVLFSRYLHIFIKVLFFIHHSFIKASIKANAVLFYSQFIGVSRLESWFDGLCNNSCHSKNEIRELGSNPQNVCFVGHTCFSAWFRRKSKKTKQNKTKQRTKAFKILHKAANMRHLVRTEFSPQLLLILGKPITNH